MCALEYVLQIYGHRTQRRIISKQSCSTYQYVALMTCMLHVGQKMINLSLSNEHAMTLYIYCILIEIITGKLLGYANLS